MIIRNNFISDELEDFDIKDYWGFHQTLCSSKKAYIFFYKLTHGPVLLSPTVYKSELHIPSV